MSKDDWPESTEAAALFDEASRKGWIPSNKTCPECGYTFKGNGWDGIDAHWRAKHEDVMPYSEAWLLLKAGKYIRHSVSVVSLTPRRRSSKGEGRRSGFACGR